MTVLGEVLITARRARGLTQEQLADATGVSQAALSRWETSDRTPSHDSVELVAAALGVTPRLLEHASRIRGATAVDAHMRRQRTARVGVWQQLEARLNMYRLHCAQLLEEVTVAASSHVPRLDPLESTPAEAARLLRMQWRLPIGPVRNLVGWLEAAGCLVVSEDFGTPRVEGLSQWTGPHPVMLINSARPIDRLRWTMAHELGHLVLHESDASPAMEEEADAFAAEFLMPSDVIKPQLRRVTPKNVGLLADLKRQWGVSMAALIERSWSLGLITPQDRTRFYKARSARGWITREPVSDELPPETPQLTSQITLTLLRRGLTDADIATAAGFASESDNSLFRTSSGVGGGLRLIT